jgi:hypothetical protein
MNYSKYLSEYVDEEKDFAHFFDVLTAAIIKKNTALRKMVLDIYFLSKHSPEKVSEYIEEQIREEAPEYFLQVCSRSEEIPEYFKGI